jgi:hypothetical protein
MPKCVVARVQRVREVSSHRQFLGAEVVECASVSHGRCAPTRRTFHARSSCASRKSAIAFVAATRRAVHEDVRAQLRCRAERSSAWSSGLVEPRRSQVAFEPIEVRRPRASNARRSPWNNCCMAPPARSSRAFTSTGHCAITPASPPIRSTTASPSCASKPMKRTRSAGAADAFQARRSSSNAAFSSTAQMSMPNPRMAAARSSVPSLDVVVASPSLASHWLRTPRCGSHDGAPSCMVVRRFRSKASC